MEIKLTEDRIRRYLSEGKRFDDRKPEEYRDVVIEAGVSKNAEGSARVKLGKTEVIVGVKMDVMEPYPDSEDEGTLMVATELLPLSSERFESGPPRIESIELARVIDRGVRESKFIDFKKLCIKKGEKVWNVFIDIYSINEDGNLFDAAGIATLVALKNAKMPKYDAKNEKVLYGEFTKDSLPLSKTIPLPITVHKIGEKLIVDPTREEEDASETRVTLAISKGPIISAVQKGNAKELTIKEVSNIIDFAIKVWEKTFPQVEKFLK